MYEYAEVYVDTVPGSLYPAVPEELGFRRDVDAVSPTFSDEEFELEFRRSDERVSVPGHSVPPRALIEVATLDGEENDAIVTLVDRVIAAIATQGHVAVPITDFGDQLGVIPPSVEVTYLAKITETHPREFPRGVVRRRIVDGVRHDEAYTRRLRWEPTEYLTRYWLGHNDVDHVEVGKSEVDAFIERAHRRE